jgi:carbamate kinase
MRVVVALGGNALLRRGQALTADNQRVYADWGTPDQRPIRRATPESLSAGEFAEGSMGPKVRAACSFVERTGGFAAIGSIADTPALLRGEAGTTISRDRPAS